MDEHAKLHRVLSIILLLMGKRRYSLSEITEKFNISERTFYRYISTFKKSGLIVEQRNGLYEIRQIEAQFKKLSDLLHFSQEEAVILNNAISAIDDNNLLKSNLRKKLYSIYDFDRVANTIIHSAQAANIQNITTAIKEKKQVVLVGYKSAHGKKTSNRVVEVFDITPNYQMIWAYDIVKKENKQFKVSRIKHVEIMQEGWKCTKQHHKSPVDVFRMSGKTAEECVLKLNLRSGNLLIEEYPLAGKLLTKASKNTQIFTGQIYGYEGVGRFCMGLIDDVEIIKPDGLKSYISKKMKKYLNK